MLCSIFPLNEKIITSKKLNIGFLTREGKGDREGIPHTHLIPLVIRLELFFKTTDPKGD